jgi:hypothetical protein
MLREAAREAPTLAVIRRVLLALVALGTVGMTVELSLIGHREDSNQVIPFVVAALGLVTLAGVAARPTVATLRLFQFVMLTYAGTGVIGITLHFKANAEFQREIDPAIGGRELFWKVVEATAPPALAPGVMVQLGLLGLVYTYKHPALREQEFGEAGREDAS